MSSSFFRRLGRKEKDDTDLIEAAQEEESKLLDPAPDTITETEEEGDDNDIENNRTKVFTTATQCDHLTNRVKNMGTFNILLISNIICFFIFIIALPAHEKAKHYKVMNDAITDLTKQVQQQKESLTAKQESLIGRINKDSDTLIEKMHDLIGVVSVEHHNKEIGDHETHVKIKQSEIDKKQIEIDTLKRSIDRHKADLTDVKSKLGKTQSKVDNFCDTCAFTAEKVITSCYRKMQYVMKWSHHLTTEYEAMAAVIELDPKCSREPDY